MESNIECDAVRCLHNKSGKCDAHHINVRCSDNLAVGDAHCNSYAYPINNAGSKLLMEMGKDMTVDRTVKDARITVACSAKNCIHNNEYICRARSIKIQDPSFTPLKDCACQTYSPK